MLTLAVRLRLGAGEPAGRYLAYGAALRLVGLAGLLLLAAPTGIDARTLIMAARHRGQLDNATQDIWWWLAALAGLLWIGAYLALVTGSRRASRTLPALALVLSMLPVSHVAFSDGSAWNYAATYAAYVVLSGMLPILALAAFHPTAPAVRAGPWLIALPVAMAGAAALALLGAVLPDILFDQPGINATLLLAATAGYLLARRTRHADRTAKWPLALAVLTAATLTTRAITLTAYLPFNGLQLHPLYTTAIVQTALLLTALVILIPLARRDLAAPPRSDGMPDRTVIKI